MPGVSGPLRAVFLGLGGVDRGEINLALACCLYVTQDFTQLAVFMLCGIVLLSELGLIIAPPAARHADNTRRVCFVCGNRSMLGFVDLYQVPAPSPSTHQNAETLPGASTK